MQILAGVLFLGAFAGGAYCCLIASDYGVGEPLRRAGRWLLATADALELAIETAMEAHRDTRNDALTQFPPSKRPAGKIVRIAQ